MAQHGRYFGDLQNEIYLSGTRPALPITPDELEHAARGAMTAKAWAYVDGGASTGRTMHANLAAFRRWRLVPRMLRQVVDRDLTRGIRCGADVLIALALGARAVLLGRPRVHGLAVGGQDGVTHVLRHLLADVELTMALAGYASPTALTADSVVHDGFRTS